MESKLRLLGHPLHPILVVFPFGLLAAAAAFDGAEKIFDAESLSTVSFWNLVAGLASGLPAAAAGFVDWWAIPARTRAKAVGLWHGLGNAAMLTIFAVALSLRLDRADHSASGAALALELAGLALGAVTGWLGGELVDRLGVGVDPGAHLNAVSSLSRRPADSRETIYRL